MKAFSMANEEKRGVLETLRSTLGKRELFAVAFIVILATSVIYFQLGLRQPWVERRNIVGIIRVEGYIETRSIVTRCLRLINKAMMNDSVKAVVLVIDSAGGYADYVEEIYLDLLELKTKKPVVASVVTALSGGYYIAAAADYIYALPTSYVGNIGVIGRGPSVLIPSEQVLESGAYKATGFSRLMFPFNLSRALDNFVSAVETNRGERLKFSTTELKKAKIYLGVDAVNGGLVDSIGSLQKAISKAAEEAQLVRYQVVDLESSKSGLQTSWQAKSNETFMEPSNVTLKVLDDLHPPPAVHYIYLSPQVINQGALPTRSAADGSTGNASVLVDFSHGNQISWWDLDNLIAELAKRNVTVSFLSQPYELESMLVDASCFIVASPTIGYTSEEIEAIKNFVEEGGLLLMFFDPAWEYIGTNGLSQGIIAPINSLAIRFGISFAKGYLYNEVENYGIYRNIYVKNFTETSLTENVSSIVLFTATHIRSSAKAVAWTSNVTWSSVAEKTGTYAPIAFVERGNGIVVAFGDLTFLTEPYCYVEDNYRLLLNLVSFIATTKAAGEEERLSVQYEVAKPNIPVGTEKNYTEWVNGEEGWLRWFKVSETETRIEQPESTTHYYFNEDGSLKR